MRVSVTLPCCETALAPEAIVEGSPLAAHRAMLIQLVVIGVIALSLPALVAWALNAIRLGAGSVLTSPGVPKRALDRKPSDWVELNVTDEWSWFGMTRSMYRSGYVAPDFWESDVTLWRVQSGWPMMCMEAYWHQDDRTDLYGTLGLISAGILPNEEASFTRPLTEVINNPFIVGLNVPESVRDAPSRSWMPIRPIIFNYLVNAAIYMIVLFALCKAAIYVWDPRAAVRRKRVLRNQCPDCGYAIVGLSRTLCPECGAVIQVELSDKAESA